MVIHSSDKPLPLDGTTANNANGEGCFMHASMYHRLCYYSIAINCRDSINAIADADAKETQS